MRLLALLACLPLAACSTLGGIDTTLRDNLPKTCALLQSAHAAFTVIAATGDLSPSLVRKENAAYLGVSVFCDNPSQVTTGNALVLVAGAYAVDPGRYEVQVGASSADIRTRRAFTVER